MTSLAAALEHALGVPVENLEPVRGGDIHDAYRATLASGRSIFVKTHARAPEGTFVREAEGLAWLAEAGARVPPVLAASAGEPAFLALRWVEAGPKSARFDRELGEMLGAMHRDGAGAFGAVRSNYIGPLVQDNRPCVTWASFYGGRRLRPVAQRAHDTGGLSARDFAAVEALSERLPDRVGPEEPPARLHGDLWSGNVMCDAEGAPVLIDPACYGGHREMDLAMLALFGNVSAALLEAYEAVYPLDRGFQERVALCQLYPLLVHAALFGGGYGARAGAVARRYL